MSQPIPGSSINNEELEKRKAELRDAYNFSAYIPDELRAQLEEGLSPEMRTAVLQLQILAIKYGRALAERDSKPQIVVMNDQRKTVSSLTNSLLGRNPNVAAERAHETCTRIHQVDKDKKVDILVAPGFLDLTKKGHETEY